MSESQRATQLWPLPGTGTGRRAVWISTLIVALVALSRVGFLPDGVWEQDEAIFATAVLDFDVVVHRPHPPAFPGWIAMGKLVHLFVGDPVLALRLISSACSVGILVLLAGLLRRLDLSGGVALSGALLFCALPGVWAHSGRAFTTTPALFFLLLSLWCLQASGSRTLAYLGWVSLAWALAVRPQFLVLAPLPLLVTLRQRWWTSMRGWGPPALAAVLLGIVAACVVWDSGGIGALVAATEAHASGHFTAVGRKSLANLSELGIVRGLGGLAAAAAWFTASVLGILCVWRRAGAKVAAWLVVAVAVSLASLFFLHQPYLPRYSPLAYLVTIPLVLHAIAAVARRWTVATVGLVSLLATWESLPPVLSMSQTPMPVVAALRDLSRLDKETSLLYSAELSPFVRLERFLGNLRPRTHAAIAGGPATGRRKSILRLRRILDRADGPFVFLDGRRHVLPGITIQRRLYDDFPLSAWELSQRRYERVEWLEHAPVWLYGIYGPETTSLRETFAWLAPRAAVWLEPGSRGLRLSLWVPPKLRGKQAIVVSRGRKELLRKELSDPEVDITVAVDHCGGCTLRLQFATFSVEGKRRRSLSARVQAAWLTGLPPAPYTLSPGRPREARALGARLSGFHEPELFEETHGKRSIWSHGRRGAWTNGAARIDLLGGQGRLRVTLANFVRPDQVVTLRTDVETRTCQATATPTVCEIRVHGDGEAAWLEIESSTFVPARNEGSSPVSRELGVVVYEVEFRPDVQVVAFGGD